MGLSDFARLSALYASPLDVTKPLYQQMSIWHQQFRQLRGSLFPTSPGTYHPAVGVDVEIQFMTAHLRAYEAPCTSSRDQGAAQGILLQDHKKPEELLADIRKHSEGMSHTGPCFQSKF